MFGLIAFIIMLLWTLGSKAEQHLKRYGSLQRFYLYHKTEIGKHLGFSILVATTIEFLIRL
jgi:hypothetical protein